MAGKTFFFSFALLGLSAAQKPAGAADNHPKVTTYRCTQADGCKEATNYVVLDSSAHWVHQVGSNDGCGSWGSGPDATACPTEEDCAKNCVMESVQDYSTIGVTTDGASLHMEQIVNGNVVSPRIYLLNEAKDKYEMLKLTGQEISFDIDSTHLPCGMNSALYLGEMAADGGQSDLNPGGAAWGTGYCDAQCYVTPFFNGVVSNARLSLKFPRGITCLTSAS
jgi:cellulase